MKCETIALQHGLTTILGLVEQGLAEELPTVDGLRTTLEMVKEEVLETMCNKKEAEAFEPSRGIGGFNGGPEIDWVP